MIEDVRLDFVEEPHRPGVVVRAFIPLNKLSEQKIFVDYFCGEVAKQMAAKVVDKIWEEFVEDVQNDTGVEVAKLVAKELFPKVLKEIDVQALTNSVLLAAGKKIQKELT